MTTRDIIEKNLGVKTAEEDTPITSAVLTTATRVLDNNPGGLQITLINLGSNDIFIWTDPTVSSTNGILIAKNGGSYEIDYTRFMLMPTREWWAIGSGGTSTISVKRTVITTSR